MAALDTTNKIIMLLHSLSVFDKCVHCLDSLRSVKSTVEGSDVNITAPELNDTCQLELKQLTLMHIPSSITEDARKRFEELIHKLFEGTHCTVSIVVKQGFFSIQNWVRFLIPNFFPLC